MAARDERARKKPALSKRQTQIVDVAMRLIATRGARCFTVEVLAAEVGVTGGAIYRHFESMEAVVDAVVDRVGGILFKRLPPDEADPIERLRRFFHDRTRTIRDNPHVSRLLLSDNLTHLSGHAHAERLQEFKRRSQRFILASLQEAADAGMLSPDVTPQVGTVIVAGAIHALSHHSARIMTAPQTGPLVERTWSAIERLLHKAGGPARRASAPAGCRAASRRPRAGQEGESDRGRDKP